MPCEQRCRVGSKENSLHLATQLEELVDIATKVAGNRELSNEESLGQ